MEAALPEVPAWVREELGSPTGKGVRIAVIDSGWDRSLEDPRVLPGIGLVDPDDDFALQKNDDDHDRLGHGTACIGLILQIAPEAEVVPVRVFGNQLETSPGTLQAGLQWAIDEGFHLINLSLGTVLEGTLKPLYVACEKARKNNQIVVAAGHNSRDWSYPAIFEPVIGVTADRFASPYEYRYQPDEAHECVAWGHEQPVPWLGGERLVKWGTSFAAPNITGIIALFLERHPGATLEEVRELLQRHALPAPPAKKARAKRATKTAAKAGASASPRAETKARAPAKKAAAKKAAAKTARAAPEAETKAPSSARAAAKTPKTARKTAGNAKKTAKKAAEAAPAPESKAKKPAAKPKPAPEAEPKPAPKPRAKKSRALAG